jgi:hydroxymethylbilane synthase
MVTSAERAFSRTLSGSCHTPLAAHGVFMLSELWLRGLLASRDGSDVMRGERRAPVAELEVAEAMGQDLAEEFLARGAARLIAS